MDHRVPAVYYFITNLENIPHYGSEQIPTNMDIGTPKISFLSLNSLLREQFSKFCPPVVLRNLSLCSKTMRQTKYPVYVALRTQINDKSKVFGEFSGEDMK